MYLVKTTNGDKILNSADAVKSIKKEDIEKIYFLTEVNYNSVISNADIRDCIYSYLKGKQLSKETVVDYVASVLDVKKNEVSKVITAMKREKIIYVERDYGSIGIDQIYLLKEVIFIQWYIADRIYTEKNFKEIHDLKQLEEIVRTEKNVWGVRSRCNQCISSNTDYSKRCLGCTGSYTGGRSEKSVDNYKFCYSYWKRFAERGEANG